MRILMISDCFFPRINGVSTSIETFRREFVRQGHQVTLIAPDYQQDQPPADWLWRQPARRVIFDPEDRMMRARSVLALLPHLRAQNFDLVHIQTPFVAHYAGTRLARALRLPAVESYHTFFEEYLYHYVRLVPRHWMRYAARSFSRSQCQRVSALVVPSKPMLETLRGYGVTTRAAVIPTGLQLKDFSSGEGERFRRRYAIGRRPTLVYVGRVALEKNIGFLLQVVSEVRRSLPDVLLIIAGEGPAEATLRRQVLHLDLNHNLRFVGYLSRDQELQDCYCAGDAFVFASGTETQGLVLLEAMSLGVPVVSTAVMGTRDVLAGGQGALIAEERVDDFSRKVVQVLTSIPLRQRLSAEAKIHAHSWRAEKLAARMLDLYAEVRQAQCGRYDS